MAGLPPKVAQRVQVLRQEDSQLMERLQEIEGEKNEQALVVATLEGLPAERKCWRLVGVRGVSVGCAVRPLCWRGGGGRCIGEKKIIRPRVIDYFQPPVSQLRRFHV